MKFNNGTFVPNKQFFPTDVIAYVILKMAESGSS